jgi:hypothetical protein
MIKERSSKLITDSAKVKKLRALMVASSTAFPNYAHIKTLTMLSNLTWSALAERFAGRPQPSLGSTVEVIDE